MLPARYDDDDDNYFENVLNDFFVKQIETQNNLPFLSKAV